MAARTTSYLVPGKSGLLSVAKPGQSGSPVYTLIGCLSKFEVKYSKDTLPVSCRQFVGSLPSGKPATSTISFEGYRYLVPTSLATSQVSADEMISYLDGDPLSFQITILNAVTGDPIYTRSYILKSFSYSSDNDGLQQYSGELESSGLEVVTTAA